MNREVFNRRGFNRQDKLGKKLSGYINGFDDERFHEWVHLAGASVLPQRCALCRAVIATAPAAPFAEGVRVKLYNGEPETAFRTGDRPSCTRATEAA